MLSNACQYAIRSILYLSIYTDKGHKMGVKKVAEELVTPQPFLAKLLQQLTKSNLVSSVKGPNGGFYLSEENKKNSIWNVIEVIDGTSKFNQCFLGLEECKDENPCPVHYISAPFKKKILKDFKEKNIAEFSAEIIKSNKVLSLKDLDILKS